ncbi:hypothetical protein BDP81DRAFT_321171 [Colletotrichum phormii]|uniref:Nephrocystin 3-like N-terminal domain-containing protein n=1 Tax=Colletotrichum phormii TaxID=359342 RepID=A0AAI9ZT27_9PEZI|nr:uncharacterized protein BDP81DRAFT_321171 [Colletotrichum phormii]KAK1636329.1 hypothetical protein BDP81DRAFT_321171 [Colletotrichum phormii]
MDTVEEEEAHHPAVRELFESRSEMHPALSESHEPGANIWQPLWDWVFMNDIFQCWQRDDNKWMLRCVGRPGSGKTTLSALVTKRLREQYHWEREAVASVFVRADVASGGTAFVEDVLTSIFHQLCVNHTEVDEDEAYVAKYRLYLDARKHGHRDIFRIKLMRETLQSRLGMLDHAFLVVDDFDRCSPAVDLFLENELAILANDSELKVLITSRVSCLKTIPTWQYCDSCEDKATKFLHVYWRCENCKTRKVKLDSHILCQECRDNGKTCINCGDAADFVQPFDHIELEVDFDSAMESAARFIDWDLETEHGDLGLGSRSNSSRENNPDELPPLSAFGRRLADPRNHEAFADLRDQIKNQARGNIGLARLRLDGLHPTQSLDAVAVQADKLPANIVSFFDAGIRRIEERPPAQRDLGLKAIAAVAHYDFLEGGVAYEIVEKVLHRAAKASARASAKRANSTPTVSSSMRSNKTLAATKRPEATTWVHVPHRSLEEMLHATRGFLEFGNQEHRPLRAYCEAFHTYAQEDYNESLVWAHAQLDFEGEGLAEFGNKGMRRSRTGVAHFVEKRDQAMTPGPLHQEPPPIWTDREMGEGRGGGASLVGGGSGASRGNAPDATVTAAAASDGSGAHGETPFRSAAAMAAAKRKMVKASDFERDQTFKMASRGTSWA